MSAGRTHILFLFSDTGGGHRSAAEAITEALHLEFGETICTEMVDFIRDYAPKPFCYFPTIYPKLASAPRVWEVGYHLSNGRRRTSLLNTSVWTRVRLQTHRLIAQHPSDMIVSVHPLANWPFLRALGTHRPSFITVVTDLATTHALWYHRQADLCLVPTEQAYLRGTHLGMKAKQLRITGLPVADRFCHPCKDRNHIRAQYGWPQANPIILLAGGGEGMGPLENITMTIARARPPVTLVVVTGRNQALRERLESIPWPIPTFIYGFVQDMPAFMQAADILVTKAGPSTVCEALISGLPMILYSRLPGQEDGNISYVVSGEAGVWAPKTDQVLAAVQDWLDHPERLARAAAACNQLARPHAARQIAHILVNRLGVGGTNNPR